MGTDRVTSERACMHACEYTFAILVCSWMSAGSIFVRRHLRAYLSVGSTVTQCLWLFTIASQQVPVALKPHFIKEGDETKGLHFQIVCLQTICSRYSYVYWPYKFCKCFERLYFHSLETFSPLWRTGQRLFYIFKHQTRWVTEWNPKIFHTPENDTKWSTIVCCMF